MSAQLRVAGLVATILMVTAPMARAAAVRVVDGDTIEIAATTYRIFGIDAPEAGQRCAAASGKTWPCGKLATAAMDAAVASGDVTCEAMGTDAYGRTLAVCRAVGLDLGRLMVKEGLAWAFRRYSDAYSATENEARAARVGIWEAATETPWDYRAHRWDVARQTAPKGCPIKGNISRDGARIYHAPWSPWYDRTSVKTSAGERWFCDEAEAVAAGWRAPRWGR